MFLEPSPRIELGSRYYEYRIQPLNYKGQFGAGEETRTRKFLVETERVNITPRLPELF